MLKYKYDRLCHIYKIKIQNESIMAFLLIKDIGVDFKQTSDKLKSGGKEKTKQRRGKMNLLLNDILKLTDEEIKNCKIEFNMHAGHKGEEYLDRWLEYSEEEKETGNCTDCSFWGWYSVKKGKERRNFYVGQIVFSFIRMQSADEWLLISVGKIVDIPENSRATVQIIEKYAPFFGRLVIKCKKGNKFARYVFNIKKYLNQCVVKEILPCLYSGREFEGYDKVHLTYKELKGIFDGHIMKSYYDALDKIKGIYCLTDKLTGKLYIGSATGKDGVRQRWYSYSESNHGGNVELIKLYNEKSSEYFENNFTLTLLEYYNLSYDDEKIREREDWWKKCLYTRKRGYNAN